MFVRGWISHLDAMWDDPEFRPFMEALEAFLRDKVDSDRIDREGKIPEDVIDGLRALGAFGIKIPVEYPEGHIPLTGDKPGAAEQVGELIAFLASDQARHISGTELWIDGAQSLLQG